MTRRIAVRFHPQSIILFGSYSRGTAGPDSDVDLLVVFKDFKDAAPRRRRTVEIYQLLAGIGISKDVIVVDEDEVRRLRSVPGTMIKEALDQGKVLYGKVA